LRTSNSGDWGHGDGHGVVEGGFGEVREVRVLEI
jgi:hypothetical protein